MQQTRRSQWGEFNKNEWLAWSWQNQVCSSLSVRAHGIALCSKCFFMENEDISKMKLSPKRGFKAAKSIELGGASSVVSRCQGQCQETRAQNEQRNHV